MTENGRFLPPGEGRLAAAAGQGMFPHSRALAIGGACLAAAGAGLLFRDTFSEAFPALFEHGVAMAMQHRPVLSEALKSSAISLWPSLLALLLFPFFGALIGGALPMLLYRRGKGKTGVPIPAVRGVWPALTVLRLFGAAVFVAASFHLFRELAGASDSPGSVATPLVGLVLRMLALLGGILTLLGILELVLLKVAIFDALRLNQGEARREQRAAEGAKSTVARQRRRGQGEET